MSAPSDVVEAVASLLQGRTRECALTGGRIAFYVSRRLDRSTSPRRVGEAVEILTSRGLPICSLSSRGYWMAQSADEYAASVAESRRRALSTLAAHRAKKRCLAVLQGQTEMGEVA